MNWNTIKSELSWRFAPCRSKVKIVFNCFSESASVGKDKREVTFILNIYS